MIPNIIAQLLLAVSLMNLFPSSGTTLNSATSWFATLPLAADRITPPTKTDLDSYGIVTSAETSSIPSSPTTFAPLAASPSS